MNTLAQQMEAAQAQTARPAAIRPGSVLSLLHHKPQPTQQADPKASRQATPQANQPQSTDQLRPVQTIPQPHVICGATQCPGCGSTWIIENYGPSGRTQCYTCKASRPATFDYDEPKLTAGRAKPSAITVEQFIDTVTKAGFPGLAELAKKYACSRRDEN